MADEAGQGITERGLVAVIWTLAGVSTVLLGGRLLIRNLVLKTFHLDDIFGALAWLLMIICMICSTLEAPLSYQYSAILIGETPMPPEAELESMTIKLRRWGVASQMLFWTSLYCVKFSFMFLYRTASGARSEYGKAWLGGMVYITLCYGICLIGVFGQCGDARYLWTFAQCSTPYVMGLDAKLIWVDYAFNVTSDLVVVILPMPVIWRLHMRLKQKLALSGICSLAIITIAFETVRTVKLYQENNNLTNLYSYLELLVSVLTSMLPSYRFLISPSDKDREYRRLFWTRITLRSYHSASSGYSMQNYDQTSRPAESQRAIHKGLETSQDVPPLPTGRNPV
ncbi:uncharacterized protein F4822DRAFT_424693 [Hypoxylon trugodes]|uniref:uncharacterized protein n=1 Tax=Hypoxylon trugodes TaxID=326681 RepID=UPI002197CE08|nr:uncharacterized protein F4822DRAFT_424693 [Hypoxylon trugodes]KAI1394217.1 hypothetical protein F4822DRAFT_424693 [Hypoxylon trugodes]